jgi:uncharacterized OB-fold protein
MPYLPPELPRFVPGRDDRPWWDALRRHELVIQRCAACGAWRHPPAPVCASCRSAETRWERVQGRGRIYSYTIIHHPVHPALADRVPYNVVLVELPEAGGVRLLSNLVDVPAEDVRIGLEVEVVFEDLDEETTLARFRRAAQAPPRSR